MEPYFNFPPAATMLDFAAKEFKYGIAYFENGSWSPYKGIALRSSASKELKNCENYMPLRKWRILRKVEDGIHITSLHDLISFA